MNTRSLKTGQEKELSAVVEYFYFLNELGRKIPARRKNLTDKAQYRDKAWVLSLYKMACDELRSGLPLSKKLMLYAIRPFVSSKDFVWRCCLIDDLVDVMFNEKIFQRGFETQDSFMKKIEATCEEGEEALLMAEMNDLQDEVVDRLQSSLKEARELLAKNAPIRKVEKEALEAAKELKNKLIGDYFNGEMPEEAEGYFDCMNEESELSLMAELRPQISLICPRHQIDEWEKIDSTLQHHRQQTLMVYGEDAFFGAIVKLLSA